MEIKSGQTIDIYTQECEHLAVTWTKATGFIVSSESSQVKISDLRKNIRTNIRASSNSKVINIGTVTGNMHIGDIFND
jgi:(p)ppGpp synthase/HD superfamily hydrolase